MDKTGLAAIVIGIILILVGAYGIYFFLPEAVMFVKGMIGILAVLIGLMVLVFGVIMVKE
jgi:uncharacterized membrane protein